MNEERFKILFEYYLENSISPQDLLEFQKAVQSKQYSDLLDDLLKKAYSEPAFAEDNPEARQTVLTHILSKIHREQTEPVLKQRLISYKWIAAAASVLLIASAGGYFILHKTPVVQVAQNDIAPDSTRAILKTGHGQTYLLAGQAKGMLYRQGNTAANKTANDQLSYGAQRELELISGEAFFEVVHNAHAPLRIKTPKETIEDIGTKFNVNIYPDEPDSRTTLTEGSVKVTLGTLARTINPGQQAIVEHAQLTIADADMDAVTAWLDNDFVFHNQELTTIMRQLARWYHIEVTYQDNVGNLRFSGMVSRNHKISAVLAVMENTGKIHFIVSGKKVTVLAGRKK